MKNLCVTIILILSLFKLSFAPNISKYQVEQKEVNMMRITRLNELMNEEFSPERLKELLVVLQVPNPDVAFAQARLETSNFTSRVFKEGNNLFGMHLAIIRDTYAFEYMIADNGSRVAKYRSWVSSVLDYALLVEYYEGLGYNTSDYYVFLDQMGYCESKGYTNLLKRMT